MPLHATFEALFSPTRALRERLVEVRMCVHEDHPTSGETVLVDIFGDAIEDVLGLLAEAEDGALEAQQALTYPLRLDLVRRGLSVTQRNTNQINQCLISHLLRYERLAALQRLGRERGGEWRAWAASVKQGLDRCQTPLLQLQQALLDCWLELTDRSAEAIPYVESASVRQGGG